ncbi:MULTISPECIES: hypothetical protein [Pseudomonas]|uniref:hypothetical protein n=1 Tax=Pseudomonas TaxID=286 RepID=UPI00155DAF79|nr:MULTISPECIES: hypothetical protein [Pseudomonas]MCE0463924.1 hypothetical protein [Pseudomonas uvaldensis]
MASPEVAFPSLANPHCKEAVFYEGVCMPVLMLPYRWSLVESPMYFVVNNGFLIFGSCAHDTVVYNRLPKPGMEAVRLSSYEKTPCSSAAIPPPLF